MNTSPVQSSNFTEQLKTSRSLANTGFTAINKGIRFSADKLELQKTTSTDSSKSKKTTEKLEKIFGQSSHLGPVGKPIHVNKELILLVASSQDAQEEYLRPYTPDLTEAENAKGHSIKRRALIKFDSETLKAWSLYFIPGYPIPVLLRVLILPLRAGIQAVLNKKKYLVQYTKEDGTIIVERTMELPQKEQKALTDPNRCIEQKKYIIHTSHPALEPGEAAMEVQCSLKTQAEIDAKKNQ